MRRLQKAILAFLMIGAAMMASCGEDEPIRMIQSDTLHLQCSRPDDCTADEECAERAHPEGAVQSCELSCDTDSACPQDHTCNRPPCVPDDVMCGFCAPME